MISHFSLGISTIVLLYKENLFDTFVHIREISGRILELEALLAHTVVTRLISKIINIIIPV